MEILKKIKDVYKLIGVAIEKMKLGEREKEYEKQILAANELLSERKLEEAQKAFSLLNQDVPESEYIAKRLKDIETLQTAQADRKIEYDMTIEEAINNLKSGNIKEGKDMLSDAIKLCESDADAKLQQAKGILADLEKATQIDNDCSELMDAAQKAEKKKNYKAAVDAYDKILKMKPGDVNAMAGLSKANQNLPLMDPRGKKKREVLLSELRGDALAFKEKLDVYKDQQYKKGKSVTRFVRMSAEMSSWLRKALVE